MNVPLSRNEPPKKRKSPAVQVVVPLLVICRPKSFTLPVDIASDPVDGITVVPVPFMEPLVHTLAPAKVTVPVPASTPPENAKPPEVVMLLLKLQVPLAIAKFAAGAVP